MIIQNYKIVFIFKFEYIIISKYQSKSYIKTFINIYYVARKWVRKFINFDLRSNLLISVNIKADEKSYQSFYKLNTHCFLLYG